MEVFSKRLKELRREKAVTQKIVAQNIGISERAYIDLENGKYFPAYETLIALADYFGVSLDWLAGRVDNPNQHKL
jgi:DNA-binding XRE family transcriptional regulator